MPLATAHPSFHEKTKCKSPAGLTLGLYIIHYHFPRCKDSAGWVCSCRNLSCMGGCMALFLLLLPVYRSYTLYIISTYPSYPSYLHTRHIHSYPPCQSSSTTTTTTSTSWSSWSSSSSLLLVAVAVDVTATTTATAVTITTLLITACFTYV